VALRDMPHLGTLEKRLKAVDPDRYLIFMPETECFVEYLVEFGHIFKMPVQLNRREPSSCFSNVAAIYLHNPSMEVAVGYVGGLGKDDLWRQHAWLVDDGKIIETTLKRRLYFGVILPTPEMIHEFVFSNLSEDFDINTEGK